MKIGKILSELFAEYFWVVGLSIFIVGATKLYSDAIGQMVVGAIFFLVGTGLKAGNRPKD